MSPLNSVATEPGITTLTRMSSYRTSSMRDSVNAMRPAQRQSHSDGRVRVAGCQSIRRIAMASEIEYSRGEKIALIALGVVGGVVLNTAFIYYAVFHWDLLVQAMTNPVSAAFMVESFMLMGFFAYLLRKWGVSRLGFTLPSALN